MKLADQILAISAWKVKHANSGPRFNLFASTFPIKAKAPKPAATETPTARTDSTPVSSAMLEKFMDHYRTKPNAPKPAPVSSRPTQAELDRLASIRLPRMSARGVVCPIDTSAWPKEVQEYLARCQ